MSKEKRLVPELRFPEFDGEWEISSLNEISKVTKLAGFEYTKHVEYSETGNIIAIRGLNVVNGRIILEDVKYIDKSDFSKLSRSKLFKGDLVFTYVGTVGNIGIIDENDKYYLGPNVALIRIAKRVSTEFLLFQINRKRYYAKIILPLIATSSQPALSMENIRKFTVYYPSTNEQQKIATFLSLIDKKIELLEKKVELLEEQKRGLLQKIFSQEIRFKKDDGSEYRKWKSVTLGSIGEFKTSSVDKKVYANQKEVYLINYMDVYRHKKINKFNLNELMKVSASDQEIRSSSVAKGDVLFTPSSETPDDIGHSEVISEEFRNVLFSYHLVRFRPSIEFDNSFLSYVFNTGSVLRQFANLSQGATRFTLSNRSFEEVEVVFPLDFEEQKIIADFLSKHDLLIDNSKQKLKSINELKKGLLQKVFV